MDLVDDALEPSTVLLASGCSDRQLTATSTLAESESQPIHFCLSCLPPGQDAEVDDDAPVLDERYWELSAIDRHREGAFPHTGVS